MPGCRVQRLLFAAFAIPLLLHAQETRSTILGRITDPDGRGDSRSGRGGQEHSIPACTPPLPTNASGDFLLPFLIPGPYSLTVSGSRFQEVGPLRAFRRALTTASRST